MKVLYIGGSGNISSSCVRRCLNQGMEVFVLNRGRQTPIEGVVQLTADIEDEVAVKAVLGDMHFDAVADFIAFTPDAIERAFRLFAGRCGQYLFISSASAYQKPCSTPIITESTPLKNAWWEYSRNKIACEECLLKLYRVQDFPGVIIRPSHTYDMVIPTALGGWTNYNVVHRMKAGKPIPVHGDGTSLWVLTHAEDFAKAFVGLLGKPAAVGHAFHITSDEVLSWDQIYRILGQAVGVEPKLVHVSSERIAREFPEEEGGLLGDKAHSVIFDNRKVKAFVPDYVATIPFHEGIRRTLAWFEADPARQVIDPEVEAMLDRLCEVAAE